MKCSSRRNCDPPETTKSAPPPRLNEVQFPKELRPGPRRRLRAGLTRLNEVQFPKELRPGGASSGRGLPAVPQ